MFSITDSAFDSTILFFVALIAALSLIANNNAVRNISLMAAWGFAVQMQSFVSWDTHYGFYACVYAAFTGVVVLFARKRKTGFTQLEYCLTTVFFAGVISNAIGLEVLTHVVDCRWMDYPSIIRAIDLTAITIMSVELATSFVFKRGD